MKTNTNLLENAERVKEDVIHLTIEEANSLMDTASDFYLGLIDTDITWVDCKSGLLKEAMKNRRATINKVLNLYFKLVLSHTSNDIKVERSDFEEVIEAAKGFIKALDDIQNDEATANNEAVQTCMKLMKRQVNTIIQWATKMMNTTNSSIENNLADHDLTIEDEINLINTGYDKVIASTESERKIIRDNANDYYNMLLDQVGSISPRHIAFAWITDGKILHRIRDDVQELRKALNKVYYAALTGEVKVSDIATVREAAAGYTNILFKVHCEVPQIVNKSDLSDAWNFSGMILRQAESIFEWADAYIEKAKREIKMAES